MRVTGCEEGEDSISVHNIPKSYGEGIVLKNMKGVIISDCTLQSKCQEYTFENVEDLYINGKKIEVDKA